MKEINGLSKLEIIRAPMASGKEIKVSNRTSKQKTCISLKSQRPPKSTQLVVVEQDRFTN